MAIVKLGRSTIGRPPMKPLDCAQKGLSDPGVRHGLSFSNLLKQHPPQGIIEASQTKVELAFEKILQAEGNLQAYAQSGAHDPKQQKELADAVEVAISEFIGQSIDAWPEKIAA